MGKKNEKAAKEKPLDKMTAKELRELALSLGGIDGVHAMNKNELVAAVKESKGIVEEKTKKPAVDIRALKLKIAQTKEKRIQAKEAGNVKLADAFRRKISKLKKQTRRAA